MKITIKKLLECTLDEASVAWNTGFEGYFVNASMTVDQFASRIGTEGLLPSLSVVAFVDGEPAGLILHGVRTIGGKKFAWNGGTAVAPKFRGKGVSKTLMEATLTLLEEEKVDIASLEAFKQNDKAISLYKNVGYEIVDHLLFLERTGTLPKDSFITEDHYKAVMGVPQDVYQLPFYYLYVPWQTQSVGIRDGQSIMIQDHTGEPIGYSLYKHSYDTEGNVKAIILFQCVVKEGVEHPEQAIQQMLRTVFSPYELDCKRTTFNLLASNEKVVDILKSAGFSLAVEQVYMLKNM